jgi:hypothetical protein
MQGRNIIIPTFYCDVEGEEGTGGKAVNISFLSSLFTL